VVLYPLLYPSTPPWRPCHAVPQCTPTPSRPRSHPDPHPRPPRAVETPPRLPAKYVCFDELSSPRGTRLGATRRTKVDLCRVAKSDEIFSWKPCALGQPIVHPRDSVFVASLGYVWQFEVRHKRCCVTTSGPRLQQACSQRDHMMQLVTYVISSNFRGQSLKDKKNALTPFLKWAGGKRWLVEKHSDFLSVEFNRYIEPFVGSGAVFFSLAPAVSIIGDSNQRLIETYQCIKVDWEAVKAQLDIHQKNHSDKYYYEMRAKIHRKPTLRAAQFIYLNRTCWNGLYRVNKQGDFNVPVGSKSSVVLATDDFESISLALNNAELLCDDFEVAINRATAGDFVFVDPPYTVKHNFNGFVKYNENIFSWDDQIRLRNAVQRASQRGAKVLVTNACHESVSEIYSDVGAISKVSRASVIAGKSSARGKFEEIIVKCF